MNDIPTGPSSHPVQPPSDGIPRQGQSSTSPTATTSAHHPHQHPGSSHGMNFSPEPHYPAQQGEFALGNALHQLEETFDPKRVIFLFLGHLIQVLVFITLGVVAVAGYVFNLPNIYESRAVIQVEQQEKKILDKGKITDDSPGSGSDFINSVVQALTSRNVLLRVVKANNLQNNPDFVKPRSDGRPYTESQLAMIMEKKVKVSLRRLTRLIDVTVSDKDPELACTLAKSVVTEFLKEGFEQRLSVTHVADDYLQQEASKLKAKLEKSEQELQAYKEQHNAVSLEQSQNIIVDKLKDVSSAVTEAKNARLKLESDLEQLKRAGEKTDDLMRISSVASLPEVASARDAYQKALAEFSTLKERYLEKHPKFIAAKEELDTLRANLNEAVAKAGEILSRQYESAKETEAKLQASQKEQETQALELNKLSIPYNVLAREVETDKALYESVVSRMKETGIAAGVETAPYRVVEEPLVPSKPSSPHRMKDIGMAFILLFVASIAFLIINDSLKSSIRSVDQAEHLTGLPVLAAIPDQNKSLTEIVIAGIQRGKKEGGVVAPHRDRDETGKRIYTIAPVDDPQSLLSEAYRTLRASITLLGPKEQTRTLLFTSAIPAEGKTFCSINTAATFALQGEKILIIDADMRRPSVHFGLLGGEERIGLSDLLSGQATLDEVIGSTPVEGLSIITAGRRAPNPAELILQSDIPALLEKLLQRFDRVILDSAPVNAVSDTLHLAGPAKNVILVIRSEGTPARMVQRAVNQIRKTSTRLAGIALNRIRVGGGYGYYYHYYGGGYYNYNQRTYGAEDEKKS
jgi:polysaccharide biosynthesis transport protein